MHAIATLHLGPRVIMVAHTITFESDMQISELGRSLRDIAATLKAVRHWVGFVFVQPAES